MGVLRVDHPDIFEFISAKLDEDSFQNFNISVGVTDIFMEAVQNDKIYELIHPSSGRSAGTLKAREVFDAIVKAAWQTGTLVCFFSMKLIERILLRVWV